MTRLKVCQGWPQEQVPQASLTGPFARHGSGFSELDHRSQELSDLVEQRIACSRAWARSRRLHQLLRDLPLHRLHSSAIAADQPRYPEDAIPGAQVPPYGGFDLGRHLRTTPNADRVLDVERPIQAQPREAGR